MSITKTSLKKQSDELEVGSSSREDGENLKLNIHKFIAQEIPGAAKIKELLLAEYLQDRDNADDDDDDDE